MKSVVMIAYYFPPEGSAGSYRPLRFVRHLPYVGWQPKVITLETEFYERYDSALLKLIPQGVEVIRIRNPDPWQGFQSRRRRRAQDLIRDSSVENAARIRSAQYGSLRSFIREAVHNLEACCYHPDPEMGWIGPAIRSVWNLARASRPDVIWASGGPISSFVVARRASCRTGIPYMLDFRDALTFTPNDFEERRPRWARRLDRRLMARLLKGAQSVVFRYNTEAECFSRVYRHALEPSKIHIIPNGFDGKIDEFKPNSGAKVEVLYTGALVDYRFDTLLEALCLLKRSLPSLINRLHFQFVGEGTDVLEAAAARLDLADVITTSGPVSHETIIGLSRESDVLLVLGRPSTKRGYELFAGAKLFGYLKAGKPILGVLPNDETKRILLQVGVTTVADVNSVPEIVTLLQRILEAWEQGTLASLLPEPTACEIYSAKRQTEDLVRALEGAPACERFVPGLIDVPPSLREEMPD